VPRRPPASPALRALTLAALTLPGMRPATVQAENDVAFEFQTSHYQEGERSIYTPGLDLSTGGATAPVPLDSKLKPIEVDSLHARAQFALGERSSLSVDYLQDTWSGATPISTAPVVARGNTESVVTGASPWADPLGLNTRFFVDKFLNVYRSANIFATAAGAPDDSLTHTLSSASPETRKQFQLAYNREWNESAASVGAGLSHEADYTSQYVNLGGRLDFNRKLTSLGLNLAYTRNQTDATFDPEPAPFIVLQAGESLTVRARSEEASAQINLSQVLGKNSVLDVGLGISHFQGYLSNPYKLVSRFDILAPESVLATDPDPRFATDIYSIRERRPDSREQYSVQLNYRHYVAAFDAALRVDYQHSRDTWGVRSHALALEWVQPLAGWTLTPRVRYYSQTAADFYLPYIATFGVVDAGGNPVDHPLNQPAPAFYSSDVRLSGFGSLSGGLVVARALGRGVGLEFGYERYIHAGDLKLGGGGEGDYADFDSWTLSAALRVDLDALDSGPPGAGSHAGHLIAHVHGIAEPAGLMFGHMLDQAGDVMLGYRASIARQAGGMRLGTQPVSDAEVLANGCDGAACDAVPNEMTMSMHMLDIMYAPADWLTLMLMPQWMDMQMTLAHANSGGGSGHGHGGAGEAAGGHETGGLGDTTVAAMFRLLDRPGHRVHLGLGVSIPTGDVDIALRKTDANYAPNQVNPTLIHYGMQLGSGTWDFLPSLTYVGNRGVWAWGAQLSGTKRLESRNESNFAFGDVFQASAWSGYRINRWLSGTVRGAYSSQGAVKGAYLPPVDANGNTLVPVHVGPMDLPANYGGRFVDVGLGLDATLAPAVSLGVEWLQPVVSDFNGYQLDRAGTFALRFNLHL
jgi:hypothetical protein